ncbi:sensor histidine kinase [Ideonella sp.]|uniref:sensor histidine kinase n=1 Tax=Ideonella sp. TaxID=1929293 RepID=UPI003BB53359
MHPFPLSRLSSFVQGSGVRMLISTQLICLGVAVFLWLNRSHFWVALLYSLLIGNLTAGLIHVSRHGLSRLLLRLQPQRAEKLRAGWPGWWIMWPVLAACVLVAYALGTSIADAIVGHRSPMPWHGNRSWLAVFGISMVPAVIATLIFHGRATIAAAEARAASAAQLAAQTRLKLLESQLEPHMLFNTLANLRALIGVDPDRAQAMLDRLIDYLRATLSASRTSLHPLSAEFARIQDYLALMQVRMGARLQLQFDLPPELAQQPVPALLLQPLVENAIKHGLEPKRGVGHLRISARREGSQLVLSVMDDGLGLPSGPSTLSEEAGIARPDGGFGLSQVRERLSTLYGDSGQFTLQAADPCGTLAQVVLPADGPLPDQAANLSPSATA